MWSAVAHFRIDQAWLGHRNRVQRVAAWKAGHKERGYMVRLIGAQRSSVRGALSRRWAAVTILDLEEFRFHVSLRGGGAW